MTTDEMAVPMRDQEQDDWCWASVTAAVIDSFPGGTHRTQCEVAARRWGRPCCDLANEYHQLPCRDQARLQDSLGDWGHLGEPPQPGPYVSDLYHDQIRQIIMDEIAARRPVCAQIDFDFGNPAGSQILHFIIIRGYSFVPNGGTVLVEDPKYGASEPDIREVISNYGNRGGKWIATFLTKPAGA